MFQLFATVSLISFVGSIHPGSVNLAVVQATLSQNRRAGLWLALGGSLPEIAYSSLAAGGLMLLPTQANWVSWLAYVPIPVLLLVGIASLRQQAGVAVQVAPTGHALPFWRGVALAGTNPQLLPFWSAVWLYLSGATAGNRLLLAHSPHLSQVVFAVGTAAGAFVLLLAYAWLADVQRHRIVRYLNSRWINRATGWCFIGMAVWQLLRLVVFSS
ncbi:LysE family translocator [Fibrella aquatilis]|uniref:LysE family transporter n=1 Tax=Fibrella aquatilis TaxID=2817059 RepID=A0A939G8K0_9BACT|nr:LysE family transporter [Fibrella aquatilis]MBO0932340.1 LysE family transporter [Fibrella aquatilis]